MRFANLRDPPGARVFDGEAHGSGRAIRFNGDAQSFEFGATKGDVEGQRKQGFA
ncbi:MAG: hypothetical protein FJZ00_01825 [Candidatus Sericytochromatia bacterium]|uniref:Uncharacterized protein n=1 Tax=Candidatus Tanganyikabacteria bacterium TaxID=2961651 RepID=A0A937X0V0_9BACT|nr:hypothetical protein [Candidatus Tanganyikabacteria bacterium]